MCVRVCVHSASFRLSSWLNLTKMSKSESHRNVNCLDNRFFLLNCHENNFTMKINKQNRI